MKIGSAIANFVKNAGKAIKATFTGEENDVLTDNRAEAYIGEAIKILIAVVIGALVLALAYALLKDTVFPTVTSKIQAMFDYTA